MYNFYKIIEERRQMNRIVKLQLQKRENPNLFVLNVTHYD